MQKPLKTLHKNLIKLINEFSKVEGYKIIYKYLLHFFKQKMKYNKEKVKKKQFHLVMSKK